MKYPVYIYDDGWAYIMGGGPILWIYSPHQSDGKWPDHFYFNPSGDFDFGVDELAKDYHENREEYILETKKLLVKEML